MKILTGVTGDALDTGTHRFWLKRVWDARPLLCFVMLNPSTAAANADDPTIRACCEFARNLGYGGIVVVNLYALRATKPKEMLAHPDRRGDANDAWIVKFALLTRYVVCAWGANAERSRAAAVMQLLHTNGVRTMCLRLTKDGHPSHPLARGKGFIPRDTIPIPYSMS